MCRAASVPAVGGRTRVEAAAGDPYTFPPGRPSGRPASDRRMDLKLHRPHAVCATTGRAFAAGEPMMSALVRSQGRIDRCDYTLDAWSGPPADALAWWRSTYPAAATAGVTLAPAEVLLDVVEELDGSDTDAALRYLLALELLRRRAVRLVERAEDAGGGSAGRELVVACRRRDREYRVREVPAGEAAAPGVEQRLAALLWSGGAA